MVRDGANGSQRGYLLGGLSSMACRQSISPYNTIPANGR